MEIDHQALTASRALNAAKDARSVREFRSALAVLLHANCGLTAKQIGSVLDRSQSWVYAQQLYFSGEVRPRQEAWHPHGGRRRELLPQEEEDRFMNVVCDRYATLVRRQMGMGKLSGQGVAPKLTGAVAAAFVPFVMESLSKRLGKPVGRGSVYNLMHRVAGAPYSGNGRSIWLERVRVLI